MTRRYTGAAVDNDISRITAIERIVVHHGKFFGGTKATFFRKVVEIGNINCARNVARNKIDRFTLTTVPVCLADVNY